MSLQTDVTTPAVKGNPYVGPQAFRRGDRLYGRDRAAADLLDILVAERIVLLHSPSGAGKTSLIQARMLGLLEDENFDVLPVVRLNHEVPDEAAEKGGSVNRYVLSALLSLEEALPTDAQQPVTTLADLALADYLAQRPKGDGRSANTVLVLDQFEEVITADPVDQDAKTAFFLQLGALLRDRSLWCLFAMREDFLAELDPYARHVPTRFMNRYRLDLLAQDEALDAMVYPARDAGVDFDPVAAGKLVDDLRTVRVQRGSTVVEELGPYIEPVQLQVVCRGMWERLKAGATRIELSDVETVGDVDQALASYYAECVASAAEATGVPERAIRDWCEHDLITPQGFRGQAMHGPQAAHDAGEGALPLLTSAHLLRAESRRGAVWYELAHDRLIDPIKEDNAAWKREHLSDVERRASLWQEQSRSEGLLLTGAELSHAETWAASRSQPLTEVEQDFLAASRHARDEARKEARANARIRRWLIVAVVGLVMALIASGFAVNSSIQAGEATLRAIEAAALGQANAYLPDDVQLGLRLAIKASALRDDEAATLSDNAMSVLQRAVDASPVVTVFRGTDSPVMLATYSRDGTRVVSLHEDSVLRVWDASTGQLVWSVRLDFQPRTHALSANGQRVATGSEDGIRMWDLTSKTAAKTLLKGAVIDALSFSPDGTWLIAQVSDPTPTNGKGGTDPGTPPSPAEPEPKPVDEGHLVAVAVSSGAVQPLRGSVGWNPQWAGHGAWGPKGSRLVTTREESFQIRDTPSAEPKNIRFTEPGSMVSVSQSGNVVAILDEKRVRLLKGIEGAPLPPITVDASAISLSGDGRYLLVCGRDERVAVYDTASGSMLRRVAQAGTPLGTVELNPSNPDRALVAGGDGTLTIWDVSPWNSEEQGMAAFGVAGDTGMTMTDTGVVRLWSVDASEPKAIDLRSRLGLPAVPVPNREQAKSEANATYFTSAALSPDGKFLAVTTAMDQPGDAYVVPLDPTKKPLRLIPGDPSHGIITLAVSPTGRFVVGGYNTKLPTDQQMADSGGGPVERGLYMWDSATGREVHHWTSDLGEAGFLQVSPDEQEVLMLDQGKIIVWSLKTGTPRLTISPPSAQPANASTDRAQRRPSPQASDGSTNPAEQPPSEGDQDEMAPAFNASAWSPDGKLIAAGLDNDAVLWNSATGAQVGANLRKHSDAVTDLSFDSGGRRLVTVGQDKTVIVWDIATRKVTLQARHDGAVGARFVRSGRRLVVIDYRGFPSVIWLVGRELLEAARAKTTRQLTPAECTRYLGDDVACISN